MFYFQKTTSLIKKGLVNLCTYIVDTPSEPGKPTAEVQTYTSVNLKWTAPSSDGGARISHYIIEYRMQGFYHWREVKTNSSALSHVVQGLTKNSVYTFRVKAVNEAGLSEPSEESEATKVVPAGCKSNLWFLGHFQTSLLCETKLLLNFFVSIALIYCLRQPIYYIVFQHFVACEPPSIHSVHSGVAKLGTEATISCIVTGKPLPRVVWKKDGRELYDGRRFRMDLRNDGTATLTIKLIEADDDGDYTVEAINDSGKDKKTTTLSVHGMSVSALTPLCILYIAYTIFPLYPLPHDETYSCFG